MLELRAVLAHMLDAGLPEHRGHQARPDTALGRVGGIGTAAATAEEALLAHLLDPNRHRDVVHAGRHRHVGLAKRGRAGRAGIRDIDYGNTGLADLLEDPLPDHRIGLIEIARGEHLDVLDRNARILEREQGGFGAELRHRLFGVTPELDHPCAENVNVAHLDSSSEPGAKPRSLYSVRPQCRVQFLLGRNWKAITSLPWRSFATAFTTRSTGMPKAFCGFFCRSSGSTSIRFDLTLIPSGRSTIAVI